MPSARIRGKQFDLDYCDRNPYRLLMQGLATIVKIAQSDDLKHALAAGQWLVEYGEGIMREKEARKGQIAAPPPATRQALIAELRGLYAKALGDAPLVVEAVAEPVTESKPEGR